MSLFEELLQIVALSFKTNTILAMTFVRKEGARVTRLFYTSRDEDDGGDVTASAKDLNSLNRK